VGISKILIMTTPTTNLDKVCRNIGRLPLELRHAIFNCLTVDIRLEMVLQKKARIIKKLYEAYDYRILDINALKKCVELGIRNKFFENERFVFGRNRYMKQPVPARYLPNIRYKQMGETVNTEHPAYKALRQIVITPKIYTNINANSHRVVDSRYAYAALNQIVTTINKSCDILPTFEVPSQSIQGSKFNYYVKKSVFQFICILTKFISKFEVQLENAAIEKIKQTFKRTVARYIPYMFRKMQRKIKQSAKIAKVAAIKAAKEARVAATEAKKEAKVAATKAKKDAKVAATKAKKEVKDAAKNEK